MRQSSSEALHHFLRAFAAGSSPMKETDRWRRARSISRSIAQSGVLGAIFTRNFGVGRLQASSSSRMIAETRLNALVPSAFVPPSPTGWFQ